jgi:hypothetical protein
MQNTQLIYDLNEESAYNVNLTSQKAIVIDHIRRGDIVGSVGPLHGPGRQRSHASAGQPGRTEGEDQLGPTTLPWAMLPENVPEDPANEPYVLY